MTPKPISKKRQLELDLLRENWGRDPSIRMERRTTEPLSKLELNRIYTRMGHLAAHLALLQTQVRDASELYCPMLLAGLIDKLLRNFPEIELNLELESVQVHCAVSNGLVPEHDAPISFFRDLLMADEPLATADWHYLLARYLRVKMITGTENTALNDAGFKQNRPIDAYADPRVRIELTAASHAIETRVREVIATYYREPAPIDAAAILDHTDLPL
jgi:hypothetical protein